MVVWGSRYKWSEDANFWPCHFLPFHWDLGLPQHTDMAMLKVVTCAKVGKWQNWSDSFMPWKYPPNLVNLVTIMIAFTFNWLGRELRWLLLHHICRKLTRHSECKSRCVRLGFCNKISSCSTFPNVCAAQLDPDMCYVFSSKVHTFMTQINGWDMGMPRNWVPQTLVDASAKEAWKMKAMNSPQKVRRKGPGTRRNRPRGESAQLPTAYHTTKGPIATRNVETELNGATLFS